ncbi:MAG: aspartate kinase [Bacteroidota bacterium]|nr:aspartate kinase [Bacteroidota bacterium]
MLTVEKIGGSSMSRFQDVLNNIIKGNRTENEMYNRIFVVSAYNNVTNWLLEDKKTKEPGIYSKFVEHSFYKTFIDKLLIKLLEINKTFENIRLDQMEAKIFISNRIKQTINYLDSMAEVLATGYVDRNNILLAVREILASVGEAHSAFNSVNILLNNNINATFVDLCGFNDSEALTIDDRIKKSLKNIDFSDTITVVTGYAKGTEGIMREFDRGYSEVTFSKIAVAVSAEEAIIHKEYHLSSADPMIVGKEYAVPVGKTNYDVADQLADIGMEAIHPKASKPLEKAGINLRIKNTFEPFHEGTLISKTHFQTTPKVEVIAGTDKVVVVEIQDTSMVGETGFDYGIMQIFSKYNISYIVKSTAANSISIVIWESKLSNELIIDLRAKYEAISVKYAALVCLIGSNMKMPSIIATAATTLAENEINIDAISMSLKQVNIQFIIEREHYRNAIILLNRKFFKVQ